MPVFCNQTRSHYENTDAVVLVVVPRHLLLAAEKSVPPPAPPAEIVFRELRHDAKVSEDEARFTVDISAESTGKGEAVATLFDGELALLPPKLPAGLRVERSGNVYRLFVTRAGKHQFKLDVVAKITRAEPWNLVTFKGPLAAIASVSAQASGADVDLQLLTGTVVESVQTNNLARVRGFLGAESQLSLRWQSRAAEVTRRRSSRRTPPSPRRSRPRSSSFPPSSAMM